MPDRQKPTFDLDRFFPYLINVAASRISKRLSNAYGERFDIGIPEWRVIAHLSGNEHVSVREIFEQVDMDKSKVTRAADRLARNGFVARRVNASDRRLVELRLTAKGRRLMSQIAPLALEYERKLLSGLSANERKVLKSALHKLKALPDSHLGVSG